MEPNPLFDVSKMADLSRHVVLDRRLCRKEPLCSPCIIGRLQNLVLVACLSLLRCLWKLPSLIYHHTASGRGNPIEGGK